MEFENLLTLIKTVSDSELTEFSYEENGSSIHLKKKKETVVVAGNVSDAPVMGFEDTRVAGNTVRKEPDIVQVRLSNLHWSELFMQHHRRTQNRLFLSEIR